MKNNRSDVCILINSIRELNYYDLESFYKNNINIKIVINDLVNQVNYQEIKANIKIIENSMIRKHKTLYIISIKKILIY